MPYFLLVYERSTGKLLEQREFLAREASAAFAAMSERETKERAHPDIEVVLLGSESLETLKQTHGRYFKTVGEIVSDFQKSRAAEAAGQHDPR